MNTFLEELFWEEGRPFMNNQDSTLEAFMLGIRFAFDLLGSVYGPDMSPFS